MSVLTTEVRNHVLHIGLNRPEKYNAFNRALLSELAAAYTRLEADPDLRCGLLFAHGPHFTAGLDLAEVGPAVARGEPLFAANQVDPLNLFGTRRSTPIVQVVQGYCFTIGIELALATDVLICAQDAVFGQIEVQRGIMPFGGATVRFHQRCGWGNAMRYLLTGDRFDGTEAARIGLAQQACETPEAALVAGVQLAERIAAQAPLAVRATRQNAALAVEQGEAAALAGLMDAARGLMTTEDAAEGMRSFVERRAAVFKGR
jgi:enoyl-CoA hydratase/carnithine racemase